MSKSTIKIVSIILLSFLFLTSCSKEENVRMEIPINKEWKFFLGDNEIAYNSDFDDSDWRILNIPHDWSIEGKFDENNPTTKEGGALPSGIGWYRKSFETTDNLLYKRVFIEFDGVHQNSEVWINGNYLGKRPNGYISFSYDITDYLNPENEENILAVKVDNSNQPNSRWYTGSGIYRKVKLVAVNNLSIKRWGTVITTPSIRNSEATVNIDISINNYENSDKDFKIVNTIYFNNKKIASKEHNGSIKGFEQNINQNIIVKNPKLWSPKNPNLYKNITTVYENGKLIDNYETTFGIRYFNFDAKNGFSLNGEEMKILGVCLHHDLGALGSAYNKRANQRQLEIMKDMGVNAIRTAHNPFAKEFYQLCDEMGFLVMDEAFDVWKLRKAKRDYHLYFEEWYEEDLRETVRRTRNNPSVIMYSIGNEIREQFDSTGLVITPKLVQIVKEEDSTRPVTCALTENQPEKNFISQSNALDVLSFNYKHEVYDSLMTLFPNQNILASENVSGLATRGSYDFPSDSLRAWPTAHNAPLIGANDDYTVSSFDNVYAYWGTTHAENWRMIKKHKYVSGVFIWTGFDYIGEPIPYPYPARSSYFGIVDLAGFPKDIYYMYQSEWSNKNVLHILPHWNWKKGYNIDVWAYYSNADEVELFLNDQSLGKKSKENDNFHVMWNVEYQPGTLKAVSTKDGKIVKTAEVKAAGRPAKLELSTDRTIINSDGEDLAFITVKIVDKDGNLVPNADNLVNFKIEGNGFIAGVDNGYQASMESFKKPFRKAFNGMCLAIIQNNGSKGEVKIYAESDGLTSDEIIIESK